MKKLVLIYNPTAGKGRVRSYLGEIVERFALFDYEVTLHPTKCAGDATAFVAARGMEFDHIVCAGGDGTLNEVVTGLLTLEQPPVLGYLPTGTTNDFSKNLKLPSNLISAADCAVIGTAKTIDMGRFNRQNFVYVAAFGLFTDVSYSTPQNAKNALGHLAYVLSGITKLANVKRYLMRVEHDGEVIQDEFIYGMVSDTVSVGGFAGMNKNLVCLNDGKFEVMLVRAPNNLIQMNNIVTSLLSQVPNEDVIAFQAEEISFTSLEEEVPWTLDGEFGGNHLQVDISVIPQALTIMTGENEVSQWEETKDEEI